MTQKNIDAMNRIVDELTSGKKLSEALKYVYSKRYVEIPFNDIDFDIDVKELELPLRVENALLRSGLWNVDAVVKYAETNSVKNIRNMGVSSCVALFETILDYMWGHMSNKERTAFLIATVENNEDNLIYIAE